MARKKSARWPLLALLGVGVLALGLFGSQLRVGYRTPLTGCVLDDGTGGASGLYRWCARMGFPTVLLEAPPWEAAQALPSPRGNVVLTMGDGPWTPSGAEPDADEWRAFRGWLERGNTLVVVTGDSNSVPDEFRKEFKAGKFDDQREPPKDDEPNLDWLEGEKKDAGWPPATVETSATEDGPLTVEAQGPRWKEEEPRDAGGASTSTSTPAASRARLAGDGRGGVLLRVPVGEGACYLLLDAFAWANAGLDAGDNARVLAGLLGRELGGGAVAVDEHRHGHGRPESFLAYFLGLPGASAALWLAFAWSVLYYYGRNVRLAPAARHAERERRTAREYIDAVAQLNERARAAPLAVEAVAGRLRQLARASVEPDPAVEALLREADAYIQAERRPARPGDAVRLVTELIQLRKRLYGSRTIS